MEKLVREYEKNGFNVKIFAPDATENEKIVKKSEIKERVIRALTKNMMKCKFSKSTITKPFV